MTRIPDALRRVAPLLILAAAVRLTLMPFTMHSDLVFIQYFPHLLPHHGIWDVYGHFGDHYLDLVGYTYYHPMVFFLHAAGEWLLRGLNPDVPAFMRTFGDLYHSGAPATEADYFAGLSTARILRMTFLWKIPYLAAETAIVALIWRAFADAASNRATVLRAWLCSPVVVFSAYAMGQHRLFVALFLWGALLALRTRRTALAAISLGFACLSDTAPLLLIPAAVLTFEHGLRQRLRTLACIALPPLVVLTPFVLHSGPYVFYSYFSPLLQKQSLQTIFLHAPPVVALTLKALFGAAYVAVLAVSARRAHARGGDRAETFSLAAAATLFFFYAATTTLVHYFLWILPFLVYLRPLQSARDRTALAALIAILFVFNLDSRRLNLGLLLPLDPTYWLSMPSFHEWADHFLPWGKVVAVGRLLFTIGCLYFGVRTIRRLAKNAAPAPVSN